MIPAMPRSSVCALEARAILAIGQLLAGIDRQQKEADFSPLTDNPAKHELRIPDTERDVSATFLDGTTPTWTNEATARGKLAEWMTLRDNRYFGRALANRLWGQFFGIGIVDPVDDLDENNPPSHPALLEILGERFASHGFRLEYLICAVTASRAYQLSSTVSDASQSDPRRFAVMPVRGLSADQLFDSLAVAVGYRDPNLSNGQESFANGSPRSTFIELFANQRDKPIEYDTSIIQAMAVMNGQFVANATSVKRSRNVGSHFAIPRLRRAAADRDDVPGHGAKMLRRPRSWHVWKSISLTAGCARRRPGLG